MTTSPLSSTPRFSIRGLRICGPRIIGLLAACVLAATTLGAQTTPPRLQAEISSSSVSTLKGSLHPMAQAQFDSGRVPSDTRLNGMSIVFNRSAAQQTDLEALIAAQQNPSSPLYHQWLNPDQFAARFGMAQSDLDKVQTWLQQQGFSIDSVARSRNMIRFSGSVNQVEQAFQTQMHFYTIAGEKHFAPSTALTLPSALTPVVMAVRNLDDFRPKPMIMKSHADQANPAFTSSVSGSVFFAPGDIKLAYGVNTLISAGSTGAGQAIAVAGQSSILNTDIENFETAAGLTVKDPNQVLVPGSGAAEAFAGDQGESDLDVEWSGGIAPGAEIFFVYTGSATNFGVFDSIAYAVDEKIGNIISVSYGSCEPNLSATNITALEAVMAQAATQGQTVVAASGDSGSSACYQGVPTTQNGLPPLATQEELAVSYPASSQYVTGVGGTEITSANDTAGSAYWEAKGSSDEVTSLLKYIPEVAWNDDAAAVAGGSTTLSSTGGGASTLYTTKPSWQTGVPGIPSDGKRDVPDVSLYASPDLPGYLYCTSDTSDWNTTQAPVQQASCNSGFRDSATQDLTIAGGTSFATPIFAGMVAVLNQAQGYSAGQGLLNPTLYKLASNSTTYAAAFNDVTTGNNECPSSLGPNYCSTASEGSYATTAGYDQVTGLGSVNLSALVTAWPANTSTLIGTTTTVAAASATPAVSTNDTITITVASDSGTTTPTGNVTLSIDGCGTSYGATGCAPQTIALTANGTATYTANFATAGAHNIVARYAGDSTHAASTGSVLVSIAGTSSGKGTFTLAATGVTVAQGSSASSTITVTPTGGYTGTVDLNFDTSNDTSLSNLCYEFATPAGNGGTATVAGTTAVTTTLTFDTNASDCASAAIAKSGKHAMHRLGPVKTSQNNAPSRTPLGIAFAGLLLAGFLGRSSRKLRSFAAVIGLLAIGLGLSACSSSSSTTVSNPPKGTYTITVTGQDSTTATITGTTTFTLVID
jgi:subtilase family serine protease